jgi:hypothetical protein
MTPLLETPIAAAPAVSRKPAGLRRRNLFDVLGPLNDLAARSSYLIANHGASFAMGGENYPLARYLFLGPRGGGEPIRIGIFATLHGDEPEGAYSLIPFLRRLEAEPHLAQGYALFIYPVCNPTGFEDGTRTSRRGRDLNREFWNRSSEPEVQLLEQELYLQAFHGVVALHSDDTSSGLYGFVRGATLTQHLLEPALAAASAALPVNRERVIDGFNASHGIIRDSYLGILSTPPKLRPKPFEIILETPQSAPLKGQIDANFRALESILTEYRRLISYRANI